MCAAADDRALGKIPVKTATQDLPSELGNITVAKASRFKVAYADIGANVIG